MLYEHPNGVCVGYLDYKKLEAERDDLLDVLYRIKQWCEAYPIDIFPEMEKQDWADVKDQIGGNMVSRISASNMRHVVTKIAALIPEVNDE